MRIPHSPAAHPPRTSGSHYRRRRVAQITSVIVTFAVIVTVSVVWLLSAQRNRPASAAAPSAGFNAAVNRVLNPSNHKSRGTLSFGLSSILDSTDPGNTYYAFMWNFMRLYTMPLMTYASCPGACGLKVVPDLATAPGTVTDKGLTWTYHIKPNVRFEDGTTVTSSDVKYAVERTFDRSVLPLGPAYFPLL